LKKLHTVHNLKNANNEWKKHYYSFTPLKNMPISQHTDLLSRHDLPSTTPTSLWPGRFT